MIHNPLPFQPSELAFGKVLERNFVKPAIMWMMRQRGSQILKPQVESFQTSVEQDSCWWAAALYLECFLNALEMVDLFSVTERNVLAYQAVRLAGAMLDSQDGSGAWDDPKGIWDTGAVCRSLILLLTASKKHREVNISNEMYEAILQSLRRALRWLAIQAILWDRLRYPYGLEDLGMIIRTFYAVYTSGLNIFPAGLQAEINQSKTGIGIPADERQLIAHVLERLLRLRIIQKQGISQVALIYWETPFVTAQIARAIEEIIDIVPNDLRNQCIETLTGAAAYIESQQDEGRWGLPNSTSVTLEAYVKICNCLARFEGSSQNPLRPIPEVVFKGLRWLAEQRASDGSMAHGFHHTVFFALMLQYLSLSGFYLLKYPVIELYDLIIWDSQTRSTQERSERLRLTDQLLRKDAELATGIHRLNVFVTAVRVSMILASFLLLSFVLKTTWFNQLLAVASLNANDPEVIISMYGALASLTYVFWVYSKKWIRDEK